MGSYKPLYIAGMEQGLIQERQEFILPNDAYPILENAFVWRERIKRKQGYQLLGRLQRTLQNQAIGNTDGSGDFAGNIRSILTLEANSEINSSSLLTVTDGTNIFTDNGLGMLISSGSGSGTINYATMQLTITGGAASSPLTVTFTYYPNLPVMGLRNRELNNINNEQLVAFDQVYAYIVSAGSFTEFLPGTTWTGNNSDFFWSTNYFVGDGNRKIFWVTNFVDPIRYTNGQNGTNWIDFSPVINSAGDTLDNALCLLPFRGRFLAFNTIEDSTQYRQRIRWSAIGTPFETVSAIVSTVDVNSWRDDINGKGGFLDIPTAQDIVSVGFVRDNLVIYCESSTWQLRYTGRSTAPFQIEKVNSELGAESTFSTVQFDTSLVGVGDKGIVECDSFKSSLIDIKIPDLVFQFNNDSNGQKRVHGIRDYPQRLAYFTYAYKPTGAVFPDRRLVYNYENKSWAIFTDSLTTLGTFQPITSVTWAQAKTQWQNANYPWVNRPSGFPAIIGGNQQGFVEYLDAQTTNQVSLTINNITGNTTTPTIVTSVNHNLQTGAVISIQDIPSTTPFSNLNNQIFGVVRLNASIFQLWKYNPTDGQFSTPQLDSPGTYLGNGQICVRDNFRIVSKKFNFAELGQNIQIGYIDVLCDATENGQITLNIYKNYNNSEPSNRLPQNNGNDSFFNSTLSTRRSVPSNSSSKNWKRIFCASRSAFLTIEWTLSNGQMVSNAQESDVQIDAQILYMRPAGQQLPIGV